MTYWQYVCRLVKRPFAITGLLGALLGSMCFFPVAASTGLLLSGAAASAGAAAQQAAAATGGRVLDVRQATQEGSTVFFVKVLLNDGRVKMLRIDGPTTSSRTRR